MDLLLVYPKDGSKSNLSDLFGIICALIQENKEFTSTFYNTGRPNYDDVVNIIEKLGFVKDNISISDFEETKTIAKYLF